MTDKDSADGLNATQEALLAAQEALRSGRHMLDNLLVTMLGVGYDADPRSRISLVLSEMTKAEAQVRSAFPKAGVKP
jgi:hypothetical protein